MDYKPDGSHFDIQMSRLSTSVCQEPGSGDGTNWCADQIGKKTLETLSVLAQHFKHNPTNSPNIQPNHDSYVSLRRIRLGSDAHLDLMAQLRQRDVSNFIPTCHISAPRARTRLDIQ